MKTKNKTIAFLEITVVLCSVFLVAMPAMANAAEEDDSVLGVYGNANEDDTIDMRDLTYVKLIFFGKKPETELADAKYDGKINPLDFIQIKLIIVGKEKELTIVDTADRIVTVNMPIEEIAVISSYVAEAHCAFGVQDRITGIDIHTEKRSELKLILGDRTTIGSSRNPDAEKILELNPDVLIIWAYWSYPELEKILDAAGIKMIQLDFFKEEHYVEEVRIMGKLLGRDERAEELINFEQQHMNLIKDGIEDLKPEKKVRVYFEWTKPYQTAAGGGYHKPLVTCGGINIFAAENPDVESNPVIDPEAVVEKDPQVIIKLSPTGYRYGMTDTGPLEDVRKEILNRPELAGVSAVKSGRVYVIDRSSTRSIHSSVFHSYLAKWFYPERFEDMDPVDIHREWMERFLGIEYKGVFAYPTYPV
jgi:iron complex transport system substrate-binding protein